MRGQSPPEKKLIKEYVYTFPDVYLFFLRLANIAFPNLMDKGLHATEKLKLPKFIALDVSLIFAFIRHPGSTGKRDGRRLSNNQVYPPDGITSVDQIHYSGDWTTTVRGAASISVRLEQFIGWPRIALKFPKFPNTY